MNCLVLTSFYEQGEVWVIRLLNADTLELVDRNKFVTPSWRDALRVRNMLGDQYSAQVIDSPIIVKYGEV